MAVKRSAVWRDVTVIACAAIAMVWLWQGNIERATFWLVLLLVAETGHRRGEGGAA